MTMKATQYILFVFFSLMLLSVYAQRGIRIGYVDMEYILENVDEYQAANKQLEERALKWKTEIEDQERTILKMRNDLNAEKILLPKEIIKEREDEIDVLEKQMKEYQQDRFGPEGDFIIQKVKLTKPVQDQVFNSVQEIAAKKKFDFVFDKSADILMLYSNRRHDISDQILRSIDSSRKKSETEDNEETEEFGTDVANPDADEQKKLDRQIELDKRREEKLKQLEERNRAYEERRRKLLEDREAKRLAKVKAREEANQETKKEDKEQVKQQDEEKQEAEKGVTNNDEQKAASEKVTPDESSTLEQEDEISDIEKRRQQRLKEIEDRKKAYEERRKEIMEERELQRKAKLEEREQLKQEYNDRENSSPPTEKEEGE